MIDWQKIDSVFFDMDGTLLDLYFDSYFWLTHLPKRYAEIHNIDEHSARNKIVPELQKKEGTLEWYCLDHWSNQFEIDLIALKQEVTHLIRYRPFAKELLINLKQKNKRLILATNAHRDVIDIKFENTDLESYFDNILCSHDFGIAKENSGFWEAASKVEPFDKERSVFIDDNLNVLRQAQEFGIRHLFAIHIPDSQFPPKETNEFFAIKDFNDLL
ncbi:MAG: GMP/IMP nucleotidase [Gammaproteobacteria bacterium]